MAQSTPGLLVEGCTVVVVVDDDNMCSCGDLSRTDVTSVVGGVRFAHRDSGKSIDETVTKWD